MDKLKMHSPNLINDNITRVRELFPGCVTEARGEDGGVKLAVDFDQLKQELSASIVEGPQERYHLNWPGKRESVLSANAPIAKTLRPARKESVNFDTTKNLFIEGDNLDALKLLQETYLGKIKLIYIDPPYNTGKDFLYEDDFAEDAGAYLRRSNQLDEDGNRLIANSATNGRFHSDWLSMLYPRLRLARNLLADDGVIFISIDDGEAGNLRRLCDEVFGESNFVADAIWRSKDNSNNDAKKFSLDHNHTFIYAKSEEWLPAKISDEKKQTHFKNPDNDPKGPYFDGNPLNSPNYRENLVYTLTSPEGKEIKPPKNGWRWSPDVMKQKIESGEIRFTPGGTGIRRRTYLKDMKGLPPSTLWIDLEQTGHNRQAKYELMKLIPEDVFDTPKPVKLISHILRLTCQDSESLILDFFAGSSTTAHAVMQFNSEVGGNRRFIMVQLPEPCADDSDAFKAGYTTIAEVSKERIRRAGKKIGDENQKVDVGFRVMKIDTSNMADVFYTPDAVTQGDLLGSVNNVKAGRTAEDLLFQVMLDWGVDLALPIEKKTIEGKDVFFVDGDALAACFDAHDGIDESFVKELATAKPLRVVFRDAGFKDSAVKINVEQIFKLLSPTTEVKSI
jgi:adenine-specific DNA-methyltransferase